MSHPQPDFDRTPLRPDRVRRSDGSFAFLPHRFLRHGFWASLTRDELALYVLLVLVADRQGMSFYYDDRLWGMLRLMPDDFLAARTALLRKDLIAYDPAGPRYQVLALPPHPIVVTQAPPPSRPTPRAVIHARSAPRPAPRAVTEPVPIGNLIRDWLAAHADDDRDR